MALWWHVLTLWHLSLYDNFHGPCRVLRHFQPLAMVWTAPHIGFMRKALTSLFSVRLPALIAVLLAVCAAVPAAADQNDPSLDSLFEALHKTSSEAEIQLLTNQIWDRWTAFDNDSFLPSITKAPPMIFFFDIFSKSPFTITHQYNSYFSFFST